MQGLSYFAALLLSMLALSCNPDSNKSDGPVIKPNTDKETEKETDKEVTTDEITVGKTLPAWKEGEMDIHFINTTTGECAFIIFPDGTQLMNDTSGSLVETNSEASTSNSGIRSRWDPTKQGKRGTQIVTEYVQKCMKWTGNDKIDYLVITHYDNDHVGGYAKTLPESSKGSYKENGVAEILDNFQVSKYLDRGWPDYSYPYDMTTKSNVSNLVSAVKWHVANSGTVAERFKPGVSDQIVPKTSKYNVKVQNIAANGEIWTGSGTATEKTFPEASEIESSSSANCPGENICSTVMRISYGSFDYFAGGDLQYNGKSTYAWKDAELPCAKVAGVVEVMKADHHGSANTHSKSALKALNPQVIVVNSWMDVQPRTSTLSTIISTLKDVDVFSTNLWKGDRPSSMDDKITDTEVARVIGYDGNIVVRVAEGGSKYWIVTTSDSDGAMTVKSIAGPYTCR